jgi:large subunit ribosomal protein L13Ae
MLPHKLWRGAQALKLLKVHEGVPAPYDRLKRATVPAALRIVKLRPGRKFTRLGDLATLVGWKYGGIIETLEKKRKLRSKKAIAVPKAQNALWTQAKQKALADPAVKAASERLVKLGFTQ